MIINWTIPLGTIVLSIVQLIGFTVAAIRTVTAIQSAIDKRFAGFELLLNTFKEGDIRELRGQVLELRAAQNEWIKALRERTHKLADDMNLVALKVDRLEHKQ